MNVDRLHEIIRSPVVSEKSNRSAEQDNQIVLKVARDATKSEIREAVEKLFEVTVTGVSTLNVKGKTKRFGRTTGRRSDWKKAYVSLAEGSEIDFLGSAN